MAQCAGTTRDGKPCQIPAMEGSRYCHIHQRPQKRAWKTIGIIGTFIAALIALLANLSQISSFFIIYPTPTITPVPTTAPISEIIENLLNYTETIQHPPDEMGSEYAGLISSKEKECKNNRLDEVCWIFLGQLNIPLNNYNEALYDYTRAYEIDPKFSDAHYALGNLYYDLALIDLIKKERFSIDADNLIFTVEPDFESKALFAKVIDEFEQGEKYPTFNNLNPSAEFLLTTMYIVEHRKAQIENFLFNSDTTIEFHRLELLRAFTWVMTIFPDNKKLDDEAIKMAQNLFTYMHQHPEEFPYMITP